MSQVTEAARLAKQAAAEAIAALDAREAELKQELAEIKALKGRRPRGAAKATTPKRAKKQKAGIELAQQA